MFVDYIKKIETKIQEIVSDITTESLIAYLKWFPEKLTIHFQTTTPKKFFPSKGEIYYIQLGNNIGSEINKERPCVVLSKQAFNAGDTIIVVPIKGNHKKTNFSYSISIKPSTLNNLGKESLIVLSHIRSISKKRMGGYMGELEEIYIKELERKIGKVLGINTITPQISLKCNEELLR